jgi:PKD repeat protein
MRMRTAGIGLALFAVTALIGQATIAASAGTSQPTLVNTVPSTHTPNINDGTVEAITQVGSQIIVGGDFTSVNPPGDTNSAHAITRNYILAFDQATGVVDTTFVPNLDGVVEALKPGPSANTVYVGGFFNNVNGVKAKGVALLNTTNGQMVTGFKPAAMNGVVYSLALTGSHLLLAGTFTTLGGVSHQGVGSLNPTTGTVDSWVNTQLTGHHNYNGSGANGAVGPRAMDVSPDGSRAVIIGNFKQADGVLHDQIIQLNLTTASATLKTDWNTSGYTAACASGAFDTYMRDVSWAPDGGYFAVVATGGGTFSSNTDGTRSLCDTTTRWQTDASGTNVRPVWINYTGNDSYLSVQATGTAIYVGGHQRWTNNDAASDSPGPGAIPRPGVVALDPVNGMPFSWNPGRNPRGSGAWTLYTTSQGLYMGSDTDKIGTGATYTNRGRIAFFPLTGGESVPAFAPAALPANIYLAGLLPSGSNTNVLYRVNAGGGLIPAIDNGPDWEADTSDPSPYRNSGSNSAGWNPITNINAAVPASTPSGVFNAERWDPADANEMQWTFPVTAATPIEVRLYFANRYTGTGAVGQRVFNVTLDGSTVLNHYDIVADTGDQTGTMKKFDINAPAGGQVTIGFGHVVENPLIDGIEIVRTDQAPPAPGDLDKLRTRSFTGTSAGATSTVDNGTIAWSTVRGAFMAGDTLFYGSTDGKLHRATFDGSTLGASSIVDPYNDPIWSSVDTGSGQTYRGVVPTMYGAEMQSVTGMVLSDGRLYYSLAGQAGLHYRGFEPDDGALGAEFTAGGNVNLSNIAGMFLSGNTLYYADKATGNLHAVAWNNGAPDAGTDTVVSGPGSDGNDWRARGLFALSSPSPIAAFSASCTGLTCSFDGSGSSAPGSSITSYAWDFGDGGTSTGVHASHTYSGAGTYTVSLTVTNSVGLTATTTQMVSPSVGATPITFVGHDNATGNSATESVTVPAGVQANDGMLLLVSAANQPAITPPSGWTLVGTTPNTLTSITTQVYRRVATGTDAGSTVTVGLAGSPHATVQLLAYRGTSSSNPVLSFAQNSVANASSLTTPTISVGAGGTWVVSYWTAKSSVVTGWTVPGSQTVRDNDNGSGSGRINSVVADSGAAVAAGTAGGITATTDQPAGGADSWTIILTP